MSQSNFLSKATADYEATFELIDVVLSLEYCLRYQVLPLELSDRHLVLGMVDPKDKKAIQELNPIINALKYTFHIQSIEAQTHQLVLVAYLKQGNFKFSSSESSPESLQSVETSCQVKNIPEEYNARKSLDNTGTLIDIPEEYNARKSLDNTGTLIDIPDEYKASKSLDHTGTLIDIPEEYNARKSLDNTGTLIDIPEEYNARKSLDNTGTLIDIPDEKIPSPSIHNLHDRPTFIVDNSPEKSQLFLSEPQINNIDEQKNNFSDSSVILDRDRVLDIKTHYFAKPLDSFKNSAPEILWQELLSRILAKGIGRLYLQLHSHYGRIICSQDGVIQSSLDKVPFAVYEGVIKEIKMMAKLPLAKLEKNQKVAIQRFYDRERILLRIEFLLGKFGEEITIQVLRGQALQFYEQRQVSKNLDQAIYLGQKLERTLKKLRICQGSIDTSDLGALKVVIQQIEKQLKLLEL